MLTCASCNWLEDASDMTKKPTKKRPTSQPAQHTQSTPATSSGPAEKYLNVVVGTDTVNINGCYVKLIPSVAGRPTVLKITSYPTPAAESFPSIFIQANTSGTSIKEIIGKPLQARVYMTTAADTEVWYTLEDQPANITIRNADDGGRIIGTIINGMLVNTTTSAQRPITGAFDAILQ